MPLISSLATFIVKKDEFSSKLDVIIKNELPLQTINDYYFSNFKEMPKS